MRYPVTGAPPSDAGASHRMSIRLGPDASTARSPGTPGALTTSFTVMVADAGCPISTMSLVVRLSVNPADASFESASSTPEIVNSARSCPRAMARTPCVESPNNLAPVPDAVTLTLTSRSAAGVTSTVAAVFAPSSTAYEPSLNATVSCAFAVAALSGVSGAQALTRAPLTERTCASYVVFDLRPVMDASMIAGTSEVAAVAAPSNSVHSCTGADTSLYLTS